MEDFVRIFRSSTGDVYHITLSDEYSILSSEAIDALHDVNVVGIELRRLAGKNATGQEVLVAIESTIAEFFMAHENTIICYYCDKRLCEEFFAEQSDKVERRDLQKSHKKVRVADFCRENMLDYYEMVEALKQEKLEVESYEEQVQCGDIVMETEAQDTKIQERDDRILGLLVNLYRCKLNNINPYDY